MKLLLVRVAACLTSLLAYTICSDALPRIETTDVSLVKKSEKRLLNRLEMFTVILLSECFVHSVGHHGRLEFSFHAKAAQCQS